MTLDSQPTNPCVWSDLPSIGKHLDRPINKRDPVNKTLLDDDLCSPHNISELALGAHGVGALIVERKFLAIISSCKSS